MRIFIRSDLAELNRNNVVRPGDRRARDASGRHPRSDRGDGDASRAAMRGLQLVVAFNYGSRDEIVRAARELAERVARRRDRARARSTMRAFEQALDTVGIPDPDLIVRTSGEQRISNFLLWQAAYAELVFLPVLWPDFGDERFRGGAVGILLARAALRRRRWRLSRLAAGQSDLRTRVISAAVLAPIALRPLFWAAFRFGASSRRGGNRLLGMDGDPGARRSCLGARGGAACLVAGLIADLRRSGIEWVILIAAAAVLALPRACARRRFAGWASASSMSRSLALVHSALARTRSRSVFMRSSSLSSWFGRPTSPPISAGACWAAQNSGQRVSPKKTWSGALDWSRRGSCRGRNHAGTDQGRRLSRRPSSCGAALDRGAGRGSLRVGGQAEVRREGFRLASSPATAVCSIGWTVSSAPRRWRGCLPSLVSAAASFRCRQMSCGWRRTRREDG